MLEENPDKWKGRWKKYVEKKEVEIDKIKGLLENAAYIQGSERVMMSLSDEDIRLINLNNGSIFGFSDDERGDKVYMGGGYTSCRNDPVYQKIKEILKGCGKYEYNYPGATATYCDETHYYITRELSSLRDKIVERKMRQIEYQKLAALSHSEIVDDILNTKRQESNLVNK